MLGAKAGVAPAKLLDVLRQSPVFSGTLESRGPLMVNGKFEPLIRLDLFLKDFRLMLDEGERLGVMLPLTSVAHQLCTATAATGHGGEDLAAVITTLERLAGIRPEERVMSKTRLPMRLGALLVFFLASNPGTKGELRA